MRRFNILRRLRADKRGTAAIEFAIVAPVFLMLMMSMFEIGWFYFTSSTVDAAVAKNARLIRTGQVQQWTDVSTDEERFNKFYDAVCDIVDTWGECTNTLTVDVETFADFSALAADTTTFPCADATPEELQTLSFEPGDEEAIVRLRICLIYKTINPTLGVNLSEGAAGTKRLTSTLIFRNEPYDVDNG